MLAPVLVDAPASFPVTRDEVKSRLRVESDDENGVIDALIAAATSHLDGWSGILGRCLVEQTWRQDFDAFCDKMRLHLWPVASITSVVYVDADGADQTLANTVYAIRRDELGAYIELKPGQYWPTITAQSDAVRVTYVAGTPADEVPPAIKTAIMLMVAHWFHHRLAVSTAASVAELPLGVKTLIEPWRRVGV